MPRSRRAGPDRRRDEGREKPKGVLPRFLRPFQRQDRPRTNPGPEWTDLGGFLFLGCYLLLGRFDESWSRFWLADFLGFHLGWNE